MAGIILTIEVDDRGTVKVKQFADESKKAFNQMQSGPKAAQGALDSLRDSWVGLTAKVSIAIAAFYAAKRMIYDTAKDIASQTMEIEKQAKVLGISTDEFQKWQYAAKMSDVSVEELRIGIKLLFQNMEAAATGTRDAGNYFRAMGISVKDAEGHLKPLNSIMMDIMDKFKVWEDGPRKIAIAMQLFGRSGERLIPLLNQGRKGFEDLSREAEKLGIILSPDLIRKGSEAEDIFKKIGAQVNSFKLSLAPAALEVAKFINDIINGIKSQKENIMDAWRIVFWPYFLSKEITAAWEKLGQKIGVVAKPVAPGGEESRYLAAWQAGPKVQPPAAMKEIDIVKEVLAAIEAVTAAEELRGIVAFAQFELRESGYTKEKDIVIQVREEIERLERETNEWGEITVARKGLVEAGWESQKKQFELQQQITEIDINRQIAAIRLDRERLLINKSDALKRELELQGQLLAIYEDQISKIGKLQDPAGYMAVYTAIDGIRGNLNELSVQLEITTGSALEGFTRGFKEYADQLNSTFEITRDAVKGKLSEMQGTLKSFFSDAMKGEMKSWKDYLKRIADSAVDIWADMVSKMVMKWIFGQEAMQSGSTQGAGSDAGWIKYIKMIGSFLGTNIGNWASSTTTSTGINYASGPSQAGQYGFSVGGTEGRYQEGGAFWVNKPTPILVGEGGQREFINIVPENKMKNSNLQSMALSFQINVGSVAKAKRFGSDLRDEIEAITIRKIAEFSR